MVHLARIVSFSEPANISLISCLPACNRRCWLERTGRVIAQRVTEDFHNRKCLMAVSADLFLAHSVDDTRQSSIPSLIQGTLTIELIRSHSVLWMHSGTSIRLLGSAILSIQYRKQRLRS